MLVWVSVLLCAAFVIRVGMVIPWGGRKYRNLKNGRAETLIVLGSGGHTAEMLTILKAMDCTKIYTPRHYVFADTDSHSQRKMEAFEKELGDHGSYKSYVIPRSREVGQSYVTSIFSTLKSLLFCIKIAFRVRPDLILVNGPGTCVPICFAAYLPKILGLKNTSIVYVESICRVKSLSLSGRLLYHFTDNFIVQWPEVKSKYPKATYLGLLS
eukprot:TRINITY_DN7855_c0_g1_i1.p1 TRINITY_DN7855_c0_g1~~TRINITY_DN7855_c0_g1_i1.p1  ORF type:complete len:212 (-),score=5.49 TRINITY_DN7855_c0_g1_i1:125-760(-)